MAADVIDACRDCGLRVPEEIAVLGVDDDPCIRDCAPVPHARRRLAEADETVSEVARQTGFGESGAVLPDLPSSRRQDARRLSSEPAAQVLDVTDPPRNDSPWGSRLW